MLILGFPGRSSDTGGAVRRPDEMSGKDASALGLRTRAVWQACEEPHLLRLPKPPAGVFAGHRTVLPGQALGRRELRGTGKLVGATGFGLAAAIVSFRPSSQRYSSLLRTVLGEIDFVSISLHLWSS